MAKVHRVGKPRDECEQQVVDRLRKDLPDTYHVYHNLCLNREVGGHLYEYDVVVVGPAYVCVIEAKNKGYRSISGNAARWELPNGRFEDNPIPLTDLKAKILKNRIIDFDAVNGTVLKNVYVDSLVVLCNRQARYHSSDLASDQIVRLPDLVSRIRARERARARMAGLDASPIVRKMLDKWFGPPQQRKPRLGMYEYDDRVIRHGPLGSDVYLGTHTMLGTTRGRVALEVYRLSSDRSARGQSEQMDLFLRAAQILEVTGRHSHIVRCYAPFAEAADQIVLPFEWIDGPTLRDCLATDPGWSLSVRLEVIRQLCDALAHAHRHRVIHRALTPDNILVADATPATVQIKVADFCFAKLEAASQHGVQTVGTLFLSRADMRYVAPELYPVAAAANPASDIYSAGMVLFDILTCTPHWGAQPLRDIPPAVKRDAALRLPRSVRPELPAQLDELFARMCAFDPVERFDTLEPVLRVIADMAQAIRS